MFIQVYILYRCIFYVSVYIHIHTDRMLLFGNLTESCTISLLFYKSEIIFLIVNIFSFNRHFCLFLFNT